MTKKNNNNNNNKSDTKNVSPSYYYQLKVYLKTTHDANLVKKFLKNDNTWKKFLENDKEVVSYLKSNYGCSLSIYLGKHVTYN